MISELPLVLMDRYGDIVEIMDQTPICGEDCCDQCAHCLHCLPEDVPCLNRPDVDHLWIRYLT